MDGTSDVIATWGWGLRRYAWIVVLLVVGLGVLVPLAQTRSADVYEAQAQVGPTKALILPNLDPLPRFAQSVFSNGAVARDVRDELGLPPGASVIPGDVDLTTAQDNPVMVIHGKGSSASTAAAVANRASATFVTELNKYSDSVGTFGVQHTALPPDKPLPKLVGGFWAPIVGALAGLVAGCGIVGLVLLVRRPVVGATSARATTGLPVLGTVPLPRHGPPKGDARRGLSALSRRLLTEEHHVVYVTGSVQGQVDQISTGLTECLNGSTDARETGQHEQEPRNGHAKESGAPRLRPIPEIVAVDSSDLETWLGPDERSLTLLVVPEGIRASSLHRLADQAASGSDAALVLVPRKR
jgi:hypothetical protein